MGVMYVYAIPPLLEVKRVSKGLEKPSPRLPAEGATFLKLQFGIILLFWSNLWAVKLSFMFFFRRLFEGAANWMWYWWTVLAFIIGSYIGCWVTQLLSCAPIES